MNTHSVTSSSEPRHVRGSRTIAYVRVSTAKQEKDGDGLGVQRDRVTEYARQHGLEIVDVVTETASGGVRQGQIGSWEHRPQLLAILDRARDAGDFDVLLVPKYDRLSRDHMTLVFIERTLAQHGVQVVSTAEENGDGATAALLRGILAEFAQYERAQIRERMAAGKARGKQLGRHVSGGHPVGYHAPTRPGVLEPDPATVPTVRRIFELAAMGRNPGRIAAVLNHEGVPSQRGKEWSRQAVHWVLTNRVYIGERGSVKRAHPPIISRKLWDEAQAQLASRKRTPAE